MTFQTLLTHPAVQALGWALLHFIWQGALLAALLFLGDTFTRRSQARLRYAAGCIVMLLMPAVFLVTAFRSGGSTVQVSAAQHAVVVHSSGVPFRENAAGAGPVRTTSGSDRLAVLPGWTVCLWLAGVVSLSMYTAVGWMRVQRLRRRGIEPANPAWMATLEGLMQRLEVSRPVHLYMSVIAEVPTVIGWMRPYILLPATAVTGLGEPQLRAILAHELAHIRRYDYLVNLLQNAIETLLFYHPAVWWVSRRIRQEREHCCDDLAVAVCGDVMEYVGALAQLEELRGSISQPAMAATGGDLLARIRRLTRPDSEKGADRIAGPVGAAMAAALVFGAVIGAGYPHAIRAQSRVPVAPVTHAVFAPQVESAPVAPVQAAPVQAAPVQAAPAPQGQTAPVQETAAPGPSGTPPVFDAASIMPSSMAIEGALRKLTEKELLLQTGGQTVLRFRVLAKTQFLDLQGAPIRDSLLRPGDRLCALVNPDDIETAIAVVLVRNGTAAERQSATRPVSNASVRAPERKDLADPEMAAAKSPAAKSPAGITISSVTFKDGADDPTILISGTGFLPRPAPSNGGVLGCTGDDFGSALRFIDSTGPLWFSAGYDGAPSVPDHNNIGLVILAYTDNLISYKLGSVYTHACSPYSEFHYRLKDGDDFTVSVRNAAFSGTVHYMDSPAR